MYSYYKHKLKEELYKKSFEKKEVLLSSGKTSDFFIDCKKVILEPEGIVLAAEAIIEEIVFSFSNFPTAVVGVALGGCPLATAVSYISVQKYYQKLIPNTLSTIYVRKEQKDHGSKKMVEGNIENAKVVILEDVITTGASTLKAITALQDLNIEILGVIVLVDRQEGGTELLESKSIKLVSLYNRKDFLND